MFTIENHRLDGDNEEMLFHHKTAKIGGNITPKFIVMHYTAGWTTGGDVATLSKSDRKVSAHLVIGRDGAVHQIVPFNRAAWHAGPSNYKHAGTTYAGLNSHSIGIEISNAGWIKKLSSGIYVDQYGQRISADGKFIGQSRETFSPPSEWHEEYHKRLARGYYAWEPYYPEQLDALDRVVEELIAEYDILAIITHEEIDTRGWKTDPGPMFPMRRYLKMLETRGSGKSAPVAKTSIHVGTDEEAESDADAVEPLKKDYRRASTNVNLRESPSSQADVVGLVPVGTTVLVLESRADWFKIMTPAGFIGWVYGKFFEEKITNALG
jgi:N-acetylmuramoyl-L-alanine amidase